MYLQYDTFQDQGYQGTQTVEEKEVDRNQEEEDMSGEIIVFSFTRTGTGLNRNLCERMREKGGKCIGYAPEKFSENGIEPISGEIRKVIGEKWGQSTFIFIGAAGIAVRYIAPFVKDKFTDSPVLVMDEKGRYVIPLLSGHVGGAVKIADEIAKMTGAEPVHTTATDVQKRFAVDVFAEKNGLCIADRQMAKEISAAVLEGEKIAFCVAYPDFRIKGRIPEELVMCDDPAEISAYRYRILVADRCEVPERCTGQKNDGQGGTLLLKPGNVIAGIGCRKGIQLETLRSGLESVLKENGLELDQVERIASIDLKKEEPALCNLARELRIPFVTYPAEILKEIRCVTASSDFVERTTGVDNVCERAALTCCPEGKLIQGKCIRDSMTAALVRRPLRLEI